MKINMMQTLEVVIVEALLPGYSTSEVTVTYEVDRLTIACSGAAQLNSNVWEKIDFNREDDKRALTIPNIRASEIQATLDKGILEVRLPKIKPGKQIQVHSANGLDETYSTAVNVNTAV
jgi:HSP20 family molecular chaperone IbpA